MIKTATGIFNVNARLGVPPLNEALRGPLKPLGNMFPDVVGV